MNFFLDNRSRVIYDIKYGERGKWKRNLKPVYRSTFFVHYGQAVFSSRGQAFYILGVRLKSGYIKLYRKLMDKGYYKNSNYI